MDQKISVNITADVTGLVVPAKQAQDSLNGVSDAAKKTGAALNGVDAKSLEGANKQLQLTGISAAQTAAAMRGIPAQFTDIVVSLQSGQAPMTVLMQQGGQLKDMFGGAGNAARAMGSYVLGLVNPFTAAAASVGVLGLAYYQGAKEADAYSQALISTGNAAGTSASQMAGMARTMDAAFGVTQGAAAEALAAIAATGQVGSASLRQFAQTAIDMEKTTGQSIGDTAKIFAELGREPVTASAKLNQSLNYLSAATYAQIKAAQDMGDTEKAASLAQDAYSKAMDGRTQNLVQNLGYIERAWGGLKNAAKETWDAMLGLGRNKDVATELEKVRERLQKTNDRLKSYGEDSMFAPILKSDAAKQMAEIEHLTELERMQKKAGMAASERAAAEKAGIAAIDAVAKANDAALSKQDQMNKALADYRRSLRDLPADQKQSAEQIAKAEAAIRDKYKETAPKASQSESLAKQQAKSYAELMSAVQAKTEAIRLESTQSQQLSEVQKQQIAIEKMVKDGKITTKDASSAKTAQMMAELKAAEDLKKAEAYRKAQAESDQRALENTHKEIEALHKSNEAMARHNEEIGLTTDQLSALTLRRIDNEIAVQKGIVAEYEEAAARGEVSAQMQLEINKLDELNKKRGLTQSGQQAQVSADAAKKAFDEWKRTADKIEDALTDALMRGFESGKSFAQNLRDTVVNMFKTMVLRPVIQGVVGGVFGLGGSAASAASASGIDGIAGGMAQQYLTSTIGAGLWGSSAAYGAAIGGGSIAAGSQAAMLAAQTSGFGAAGTLATASAAGTGSSMMATAAAAGPYVLAAVAVLNAMGVFRSTKTVGGGIVGTLGTGSVQSYDLQREGGTLFNGPSYSVQGMAATAQTAALENAFVTLRTSTAQMAKDLGLSTDKVNQFTMAVGDVQVHPDIQQLGLVLDGLSEPQKLEAINQLLQKSADGMAQVVLGAGATAQQLAQVYAATMQERKGLELQLLQVQGDTVEIRNRERAALQESNRAIYDQINALQDSKAATEAAAQAEAAIAQQRQGLQDQLDQLLGNTAALRERERNALDASNRSLYDQINALQDSKTAAEQAAQAQQAATDNAWALVERSANAERTLVQARIDAAQRQAQTLGSIFAALQSGVDDLYRDTLSVQQQAAVQGRAFITQALSTAQRTGYLPDAEGLQSAIAAVRGGMAGKQYTSAFEQERDRLILAGELSQLKDITGEQLSESERMLDVAQQQLKGIDTQVALAKAQIDATQGVNTSVVSLSAALQNLAATQAASRIASNGAAGAAGAAGGASGAMAGLMPAGFISSQGSSGTSLKDLAAALYGSVTTGYDSRKFDTAVNAYGGAQKAFAQLGWDGSRDSAARIAAAYGVTNVPKFAAGGLHSGGLRLVGEKGPELEVTGPARYYDANKTRDMLQGGGTGPDASAEIRSLREELAAQSRALVQSQTRMNRLLERWDGEGMPQERTA